MRRFEFIQHLDSIGLKSTSRHPANDVRPICYGTIMHVIMYLGGLHASDLVFLMEVLQTNL